MCIAALLRSSSADTYDIVQDVFVVDDRRTQFGDPLKGARALPAGNGPFGCGAQFR